MALPHILGDHRVPVIGQLESKQHPARSANVKRYRACVIDAVGDELLLDTVGELEPPKMFRAIVWRVRVVGVDKITVYQVEKTHIGTVGASLLPGLIL